MSYSEADIRAIFIDTALHNSEWTHTNIKREFYFKYSENDKERKGFVDYLLKNNETPVAIIEAKRKNANTGLQKVIRYAKTLQVRFVYAADGKVIYEYDMSSGRGKFLDRFPTLQELVEKLKTKPLTLRETLQKTPLYVDARIQPRHYQLTAIDRIIESIADLNKKALIKLPPQAGKSFVVFQVLHKLIQSSWNIEGANRRPKILFLSDLTLMLHQSANLLNQVGPQIPVIFINEENSTTGNYPESGVFFSTYHMLSTKQKTLERYRGFSKGFFDFIVADECQRLFISDDSSHVRILTYFTDAVQLGVAST